MNELFAKLVELLSAPAIIGSICMLVLTGVKAFKGCIDIQRSLSNDTDSERIKEIHDQIVKGGK